MYNLIFLLACVILAILFGKMLNVEIPNKPRPVGRIKGTIEKGNFTYFYINFHGAITLNLTSLSGDADLYISDTNMHPTFDPEIYDLHSATCGQDIIELPESFESPLAVAVYGYAECSKFVLEVYKNTKMVYPYKLWVSIDRETDHFKQVNTQEANNVNENNNGDKRSNTIEPLKKKKKSRTSSTIPSVFSVLEILQLIFL